jgi:putative ABC transport system ATP-binding protein
MKSVIEARALTKEYRMGSSVVRALAGVNLTVAAGEFLAVMGASGSGKSTLMNVLGCLDRPTSGEYYLNGKSVNRMSRNQYADIRNQEIGFVFQTFNLLPRTSALENVELPLFYDRTGRRRNPRELAKHALRQVGLADRCDHEPNQLSGGEQQRVAIARALVNEPDIILADEPTGNLDTRTSAEVMEVFQELNDRGITILLVTHEHDISEYTKRIVELRDGVVIRDTPVKRQRDAGRDLEKPGNGRSGHPASGPAGSAGAGHAQAGLDSDRDDDNENDDGSGGRPDRTSHPRRHRR